MIFSFLPIRSNYLKKKKSINLSGSLASVRSVKRQGLRKHVSTNNGQKRKNHQHQYIFTKCVVNFLSVLSIQFHLYVLRPSPHSFDIVCVNGGQ